MSDDDLDGDEAAGVGSDTEGTGGGRTAVVTKPVTRPQRPTGKRSRRRAGAEVDEDAGGKGSTASKAAKQGSATKAKKAKKAAGPSANPITFIYNYLKQVVAEMRKVIWPSRKQMLTYTSVVLVFLAFMVTLVALADFGLAELVTLVFG